MKIGNKNIKYKSIIFIILFVIVIVSLIIFLNRENKKTQSFPSPFLTTNTAWADTTLKYLSLNEKIAQLIIYDAGFVDENNQDEMISNLNRILPGGIIYKTDSLANFIKYQNNLQKISKINLFTSFKSETVIPQFLDFNSYPDLYNLLSVKNDSIIEKYIELIASINKKLNISFNLLPKIQKVKNDTLFSKDYLGLVNILNRKLKEKNILACMPENNFFKFDSSNFKNNNAFIESGLLGFVVKNNSIVSASSLLQSDFRTKYNFGGFSILQIQDEKPIKDSILSKIKSGTELFISKKPEKLKSLILELINDDEINENDISQTVRKILLAKTWSGLENNIRIEADSVLSFIQKKQNIAKLDAVYKNTIILLKNENDLIPLRNIQKSSFTLINIGKIKLSKFKDVFSSYHNYKSIDINISKSDFVKTLSNYKKKANLIISINNTLIDSTLINAIFKNNTSKNITLINFGELGNLNYTDSFNSVIQAYGNSELEQKYAADALFGGIKIQGQLPIQINDSLYYSKSISTNKIRVAKVTPEDEDFNSEILAKIDSIAKDAIRRGAFPGCQVVVLKNGNSIYDKSFGYHTYSKQRKVRHNDLYDLASITKVAATTTAAMRMYDKGRLGLNSHLGKYFRDKKIDYSNIEADTIINIDTLLFTDVTDFKKLLRHQDTIHISDSSFIAYDTLIVTATPKSNIFKVRIKDLLLHKSGISPTLPILPYIMYKKNYYDSLELIKKRFYTALKNDTSNTDTTIKYNVKEGLQKLYDEYFTHQYIKDSAETKIANGFYLQNRYFDTLWRDTKRLRVYSRKIYQYSDINMILLQQAIDSINRRGIDKYMRYNIYQPMGLNTMCYKPTNYFSRYNIVPTENDKYWRVQTLRGNVHDPSAAMLGRVSGNAGLFSNAYDLAILGQMWLNGGSYGGRRYISEKTINKFTGFQEDSHRGLGFDKPTRKSIIGKGAPKESYGHTGFTGTCIWVDPVNDIVFVFLSNRVHPSAKNWRINRLKIRQKIHTVVYDAMKK